MVVVVLVTAFVMVAVVRVVGVLVKCLLFGEGGEEVSGGGDATVGGGDGGEFASDGGGGPLQICLTSPPLTIPQIPPPTMQFNKLHQAYK